MRAADRPHSLESTVTRVAAGSARQALIRLMIAIFATIALLFVWRPAVVQAQARPAAGAAPTKPAAAQPKSAMHVVRAGESLWSLAVRYYGDGNAWSEMARANGVLTTSARPIVVGMRLTVPAQPPARPASAPAPVVKAGADVPKPALAEAIAPRVASTAAPAAKPAASTSPSLSAQTAGKPDAAPVSPRTASRSKVAARRPAASRTAPASARAAVAAAAPKAVPAGTPPPDSGDRSAIATGTARAPLGRQLKTEVPLVPNSVRIGLVEPGAAAAARGSDAATIFIRRVPTMEEAQAQARAAMRTNSIVPRRGEYDAAPFALTASRLAQAGRIVRRVGTAAVGSSKDAQRVIIADEVEITAPAGTRLSVGDRLYALRDQGALANGNRIGLPGGVLVVTQADAGKPVIAVVRSQSGLIEQGHYVVGVTGEPASAVSSSAASADQLRTSVLWVENEALLPTLQSYLLLGSGTAQGVQAGDEFALVKARGSANTGEEQRIAVVRVVRSDALGSTAIVVRQDRGEIAPGVIARRVARAR